jgi:3-deoxy-D-manno-octulosonic-acid transferase
MCYVLNLFYVLLALAFSPWLLYAAVRKGKYRDGWGAKLWGRVPTRSGQSPCVWLHAVSVGEVNLLQPVLDEFAQQRPTWECVISTTTRTGYELARKKYTAYRVFYCPLDFSWAVRTAMRRIRPSLLILAELELWPNLVHFAHKSGAKVAIMNGRLSDNSFRGYRRIRPLVRSIFKSIDLIAVQNQQYADRFLQLGARPETVSVTGSIKFDGALTDRQNSATQRLRSLWQMEENDVVFLAGSTQHPEEQLAVDTFTTLADNHPQLRLILVPRHPERFDKVAEMLDCRGLAWQRRSDLVESSTEKTTRILLVDVVGELGAWWGTALMGFVGGSMGSRGGQNMIEPAAFGVAVSFGPNTSNFRDVVALLMQRQAAVVVQDGPQMTDFVGQCLDQPGYADRLGRAARELVLEQQGATARTVELLLPLVSVHDASSPSSRPFQAA